MTVQRKAFPLIACRWFQHAAGTYHRRCCNAANLCDPGQSRLSFESVSVQPSHCISKPFFVCGCQQAEINVVSSPAIIAILTRNSHKHCDNNNIFGSSCFYTFKHDTFETNCLGFGFSIVEIYSRNNRVLCGFAYLFQSFYP